jgi:5-methylcytosine-specific restriction endonuclease McrA
MSSRYPHTKGPDGKNVCRYCRGEVPRPRIYWCSDTCVDAAYLRCDPSYQRRKVEERDLGVCVTCGLDTEAVRRAYRRAMKSAGHPWAVAGKAVRGRVDTLGLAAGTYDIPHFWEMDHIVPVIEGGDEIEDTLGNLRTLCIPCHKRETKELAGRRAKERRTQLSFEAP